jgi:hypothetical protein
LSFGQRPTSARSSGSTSTWAKPPTNADIRDKYAKLTHRAVSADRQAAIEKAILGIDTLYDIAELTALLTPAVRSPLD